MKRCFVLLSLTEQSTTLLVSILAHDGVTVNYFAYYSHESSSGYYDRKIFGRSKHRIAGCSFDSTRRYYLSVYGGMVPVFMLLGGTAGVEWVTIFR
jgi:hypothetical protein